MTGRGREVFEHGRELTRSWRLTIDSLDLIPSVGAPAAASAMFLIFLLTDLAAAPLQVSALIGFGFAAGSAVAAGVVRKPDLLFAVTAPPLIFLTAVTCAELITAHLHQASGSAGRIGAGVFLTLSAAAPWMFGGLAGAIAIAVVRGLPQCVRDLRAELAGRRSRGAEAFMARVGRAPQAARAPRQRRWR